MRSRLFPFPTRCTRPPRLPDSRWKGSALPPNIIRFQYAVRGELAIKAQQYDLALQSGQKLPFDRVVYCNIGNPHQLGQHPLTFVRQVISLVENVDLFQYPQIDQLFPSDAIDRARHYLRACRGATGAYSESAGLLEVRKSISKFVCERDGQTDPSYCDPNHVYLSNGASPAIQDCLRMIIRDHNDGILIPIPQYPLYSGSVPLLGGQSVGYFLDEDSNWGLRVNELDRAIREAKANGVNPRAIVIINPGNPTGSCLPHQNIAEILDFAHANGLIVLADEVYQRNVYTEKPFISFKRVLHDMGANYKDQELLSFHSISKGLSGECGKRGGYVEMTNIDPEIHTQYYKLQSMALCPNIIGQLMMALMVNPPKPGDPSYPKYHAEETAIFDSLKRRSESVYKTLNSLEGISCQKPEGALYAFPRITLPAKAIAAAKEKGKAPDTLYCLELLDETGLCVVPGSGFGQVDGTWHFRTTILPQENDLKHVLERFGTFHKGFLERYN